MNSKRSKYVKRSRMPHFSRKQLYGLVVVTLIVVSSLAVYAFFSQPDYGFKAGIVDQLSSREDYRNATFVNTANATLTAASFRVSYHKGSEVTVNFYRSLPLQGYRIILLRVHSALYNGTEAPLDLFTSEPYTHEYAYEQTLGWLDIAKFPDLEEEYFGILHGFVANAMQGRFQDTVIIMMGCNGLDKYARSQAMLQTLVGKGAKLVIGWDEAVNVQHTDKATARLLYYLLMENRTVKDAVDETMTEVGPDPYFNSALRFYPNTTEVANYKIPQGTKPTGAGSSVGSLGFAVVSVCALPLLMSFKKCRLACRNVLKRQDRGCLASRFR